jgi:hypothetical protein
MAQPDSARLETPMELTTHRPELDEHDFKTLRELYSQAQNWTRHYETLLVSTNVLLVSAASLFVGLALRDGQPSQKVLALLLVPVLLSVVGLLLTRTLFKLYDSCVQRLIAYENVLNCFAQLKSLSMPWGSSLLPPTMMALPVKLPLSARFFLSLHSLLIVVYVALAAILRHGA